MRLILFEVSVIMYYLFSFEALKNSSTKGLKEAIAISHKYRAHNKSLGSIN
jgi:hypothetical protein